MDTILVDNVRNSIGIIPARLESTRLPRKLLLELEGKPVLQWTLEGASKSKYLNRLLVATDSKEIASFCSSIGFDYILTPGHFSSGTDRVFWAYESLSEQYDLIVNIQGDEPFIDGEIIDNLLLDAFRTRANISTLVSKITEENELFDPATVKVVFGLDNFALYFSRSAIPFVRDANQNVWLNKNVFFKHIGVYCFTDRIVKKIKNMVPGKLETVEKLEQLRWLENGEKIFCVQTDKCLISIDTQQDLERARKHIKDSLLK